MTETLRCICCKRPLQNVHPDLTINQPSNASVFRCRGNYGSTVFDPMDSTFLEVNICDPCLITGTADDLVLLMKPPPPPSIKDYASTLWRGPEKDG